MSSGSVNMTGVNSCVFTQVFYFESIFQKHVCLSPLVLGWTSLVWIWFWFWSADWRIKCVAAVPDCDHWGAVNTPPARQHRHPYTDSFKIKAQVKEIYPVCRFVSKHSCQQLFNFICRWVYVLMQRLLCGLLNIHIWMNECLYWNLLIILVISININWLLAVEKVELSTVSGASLGLCSVSRKSAGRGPEGAQSCHQATRTTQEVGSSITKIKASTSHRYSLREISLQQV